MDEQSKPHIPETLPDVGTSVLKALAATTPQLQSVSLPAEDAEFSMSPVGDTATSLHRYSFEGEIARGGMGAVLKGRDIDLGREVAVKVMLETHRGKTELLQRFVEEAQIAGQLQHPGITPVYELGQFPDQRPFFTMKLVRGETLANLLQAHHQPASESGDAASRVNTSRSRLLKIFEQVCQTLAYAHARRVIHRDLKPQNIMVGKFGEVQVMDWGLAKVLGTPEKTTPAQSEASEVVSKSEDSVQTKRSAGEAAAISETQPGSIMGTVSYMAPEQARGEVDQLDERCDVFGLGSILCEILTGKPAYLAKNAMAILDMAARADLSGAYTRLDQCGADAELVALARQCLAADRENRPRDAGALTDALTRYLSGVEERLKQAEMTAVEARTQAKEEKKRRRVTMRLAGAILLTLLAGLGASLWQMRRAMIAEEYAISERDEKDIQKRRAETNEKFANEQKILAQDNAQKAIKERDRADQEKKIAQAVREFLQHNLLQKASVVEQANAVMGREGKTGAIKHDITIRELLDRAAEEFSPKTIDQKFPLQFQVQAEILETIGEAYEAIGDDKKAVSYVKASAQVLEKNLGGNHAITLAGLTELVFVHISASQHSEACNALANLINRLNSVMEQSQKEGNTVAALATLDAVADVIERRLDVKRHSLPTVRFGVGDAAMALLQLSRSIGTFEKFAQTTASLCGEDDRRTWYARMILGFAYHATAQFRKAVDAYEKVLAKAESRLPADDLRIAGLRLVLSIGYEALGTDLDKRVALKEQSYESMKRVLGKDHPQTHAVLENLAIGYYDAGKLDLLVPILEDILKFRKQRFEPGHPMLLQAMNNLAAGYQIVGKIDLSIPLHEETLKLLRAKHGDSHGSTISSMNNLAEAYHRNGQYEKSIKLHEEAIRHLETTLGKTHSDVFMHMRNLGDTYQDAGQFDKAQAILEEALKRCKERHGPTHQQTIYCLGALGALYEEMGQGEKALQFFQESLQLRRKHLGPTHPDTMAGIHSLASYYEDADQVDKAIPYYQEVLQLSKARFGLAHQDTHEYMRKLAIVYRKAGQFDQSIALLQEELKLRSGKELLDHDETRQAKAQLGISYVMSGKLTEGIALLESVYALRTTHGSLYGLIMPLMEAYARNNQKDKLLAIINNDLETAQKKLPKKVQLIADHLALCSETLLKKKDDATAELIAVKCLALRQLNKSSDWKLHQAQALLGAAQLGLKNYAAAEKSLLAAHAGLESQRSKMPAEKVGLLSEVAGRLASLYESTGKKEEAARWRK